jgi:hypothetical protein
VIDRCALRNAMHEIADRKGDLTLFALFLRADAPGTWDPVVSAPWLESSKLKATRSLGRESLQQFSRVEAVTSDDPTVQFILNSFPVEDGERDIQSTDLFGLQIEKAIIFRAWRPGAHKTPGKDLQPTAAGPPRRRRIS